MADQRNRDILFYIETETQFESVRPLLEYLRGNTKITFDIVVPSAISGSTINNKLVYDGAAALLIKNKFTVVRSVDDVVLPDSIIHTQYSVLLAAYMYQWHYENLNVNYRVMFPYASYYFNKPNWTIDRFIKLDYMADAVLSHAVGTKPVTDIFTRTHVVPSLKLMDFRKKTKISNKQKPILFFAPSYGEMEFTVNILKNIDIIKEKYTFAVRGHHRSTCSNKSMSMYKKLKQSADKIYDEKKYTTKNALEDADIIVSDNSAIIFDAIYCGIPVVLFSQNPNSFNYKNISTSQSNLVEQGDILWTNRPEELLKIVDKTLTGKMLKTQKEMSRRLFPVKGKSPVEAWLKALEPYINDELMYDYRLAKKYWIDDRISQDIQSRHLSAQLGHLKSQIKDRENKLYLEQNPGIILAMKRLAKAFLHKVYFLKRRV